MPRAGNDDIGGQVVFVFVGKQRLPRKRADTVLCAQNRAFERLAFEERHVRPFGSDVLRRILVHKDFFEHNPLLFFELVGIEHAVEHDIREDIRREFHMLVEHLCVKAGTLLACKGVEVAAHGVHLYGNLLGAALFGSLEHHVLNQVRSARRFRRFPHGTGIHPNAHGQRADVIHALIDQPDAVWQCFLNDHFSFLFGFFAEAAGSVVARVGLPVL